MATMYIDYAKREGNETDLQERRNKMNTKLNEIMQKIQSFANVTDKWESDAAYETRKQIEAMQPVFDKYYAVVDSYINMYHNAVVSQKATEDTLANNAETRFTKRDV